MKSTSQTLQDQKGSPFVYIGIMYCKQRSFESQRRRQFKRSILSSVNGHLSYQSARDFCRFFRDLHVSGLHDSQATTKGRYLTRVSQSRAYRRHPHVVRYVLIGSSERCLSFAIGAASSASSSFFFSGCEPVSSTRSLGNMIARSSA